MKRVSLVFALIALSVVASADTLRSQIMAFDRSMSKVMLKRDTDGFAKNMKAIATPDFKYSESGRTTNLDQMLMGMKMGLGSMKKVTTAESKLLTLKEKGSMATATTYHKMVGITVEPKTKKTHTLGYSGTSQETYRKIGGKWKLASMTWMHQDVMMDGKPMKF